MPKCAHKLNLNNIRCIIMPAVIVIPGVVHVSVWGDKLSTSVFWYPEWRFASKRYYIYSSPEERIYGQWLSNDMNSAKFKKTYIDMIAAREHAIDSILTIA